MHFHLKNSKGKETNPWIIILLHIKSHFVCQNIREVFIVLGIYHLVVHTIIKARPMRANMEFEFTVSDFWALTYYSNLYYLSYGYDFATAVKSLFVINSMSNLYVFFKKCFLRREIETTWHKSLFFQSSLFSRKTSSCTRVKMEVWFFN